MSNSDYSHQAHPLSTISDSNQTTKPNTEPFSSFELWKTTKIEVHRLNLGEFMGTLDDMAKAERASYFSNPIPSNKKDSFYILLTMLSLLPLLTYKFSLTETAVAFLLL